MPTQQTALGIVLSTAAKVSRRVWFYGWSGEAVDEIESNYRMQAIALALIRLVKFKPTDVTPTVQRRRTDFAQALKRRRIRALANRLVALKSTVQNKQGRVVGSLCVVSAKRGEITSAMLASGFPKLQSPGLTLRLPKTERLNL